MDDMGHQDADAAFLFQGAELMSHSTDVYY